MCIVPACHPRPTKNPPPAAALSHCDLVQNLAFRRALLALAHPVIIGVILLMLANDHVFKDLWGTWWTGKLSDVTWVAFTPLIFALPLAWLVPQRFRHHERTVALLAFGSVGLWYGLFNTVDPVHGVTLRPLSLLTGWTVAMERDWTDVLTLPGLLIGWWVWRRQDPNQPMLRAIAPTVVALGVLATVATSSEPDPTKDYGITCLASVNGDLYAFVGQGYDDGWESQQMRYVSNDGGLRWRETSTAPIRRCISLAGRLINPLDPQIRFRFEHHQAIERSIDRGETWAEVVDLTPIYGDVHQLYLDGLGQRGELDLIMKPVPVGGVVHRETGNAIFAMSQQGVLVITENGDHQWVTVGAYGRFDDGGRLGKDLEMPVVLALGLAPLLWVVVTRRLWRSSHAAIIYPLIAATLWAGAVVLSSPVGGTGAASVGLLVFSVFITVLLSAYVLSQRALQEVDDIWWLLTVLAAALSLGLFMIPFVLWSQSSIPRYETAALLAIGITGAYGISATVFLSRLERRLAKEIPSGD